MQIPTKWFYRKKLTIVLRILLMAICSGTCWWLTKFVTVQPEIPQLLGVLTIALVITGLWSALRKVPENRQFTLSPAIIIPAPLIHGGLDTSKEPIEHWLHNTALSEQVFFTTHTRSGTISKFWFDDEQWHSLLANLPTNKPISEGAARESVRSCFVILFGLFLMAHWLGEQSQFTGPLRRLLYGAHNWQLVYQGDWHRLLSYAFLHTSELHLLLNSFGLLLGASALRKGYSNFSLAALVGTTTVVSVIVGAIVSRFDLVVGASGLVLGIFGFLVAAQLERDPRLHPINRVARHKYLYLILVLELVASYVFDWYGGIIHITGFLIGFAYYRFFESQALSAQIVASRRKFQWITIALTCTLCALWAVETYRNHLQPHAFVDKLMAVNDPALTAIAALAVPDKPDVTEAEVRRAKKQAQTHLERMGYNAVAIARADYWLGNTNEALIRIRAESAKHPTDELIVPLWLAIEKAHLADSNQLLENNRLPAGTGGAYLMSDDGLHLARLQYKNRPINLSAVIRRPKHGRWRLIANVPALPKAAEGVWPLEPNQFRTRQSAAGSNH